MSIRIIRFERHHLDDFEAAIDDPDVGRHTPLPFPAPAGYGATWLGRYETGRANGTREAFAIIDEDDRFLGIAVAASIDTAAREAELGYLIAPWARGRGAATAALLQLTRWAFDEQDMARASLHINVGNERSRQVARRAGYSLEGVLRSTWLKDDVRVDTEVWSRLPDDPEPV